jgi:hypothetical protein
MRGPPFCDRVGGRGFREAVDSGRSGEFQEYAIPLVIATKMTT